MFEGIPRTAWTANPIVVNAVIKVGPSRTEAERLRRLARRSEVATTLPAASTLVSLVTTAKGEAFAPGRVAARRLAAFGSGGGRRAGMDEAKAVRAWPGGLPPRLARAPRRDQPARDVVA